MQDWHHRRLNLGLEISVAIGALFVVIAYSAWRYPGSTAQGGMAHLVVIYAMLVAYGAGAIAVRRTTHPTSRAAMRRGSIVGLLVAAVGVLNTSLDQFVSMSAASRQNNIVASMR